MLVLEDLGDQYGWEKINPTSAAGITATIIQPTGGLYKGMTAKAMLINVETNPIRIRMDGTAATATDGMLLKADTYYTVINAANIRNFSCIDTSAGASAVHVLAFF